jgi:hypothetical protein
LYDNLKGIAREKKSLSSLEVQLQEIKQLARNHEEKRMD